jgi:hypothetical protein
MAKRVCYIHIGPHKTGTTSIQWFLKENRAALLKHGYFVPESGNIHGGHHPLVRRLCGQPVPPHQWDTAARFARAIKDTFCEAVVISSEALDGLLVNRDCARQFFGRMEELNLEPKLVFFPRNQSAVSEFSLYGGDQVLPPKRTIRGFCSGRNSAPKLAIRLLHRVGGRFQFETNCSTVH